MIAAVLVASPFFMPASPTEAGGETRTISLYHVHTKESLTVTYKVNGRYIPSAMTKINHLMRDWRRNETIKMDPETVDLMWELHADLGSTRPIHIICGFRSPKTNAFLKRIGRNVARKSQHMVGKAIDMYFPDVPTVKIRNSALVRKVGGVGYYRSSGGPSGFVHIDSGNVRHWGPAISSTQMAQIERDYKKTVGARLNRKDMIAVTTPEEKVKESDTDVSTVYEGVDEDADEAAEAPARPTLKPALPKNKPAIAAPLDLVAQAGGEIAEGYPVPLPRPKPIEVLMIAAANMTIEPASAPVPRVNFAERSKAAADSLGVVAGAESLVEEPRSQSTNIAAKGSFADELRDGTAKDLPLIKPLAASASGEDLFWWPKKLIFSPDQAVRRDGAPQEFAVSAEPLDDPKAATEAAPVAEGSQSLSIASLLGPVSTSSGKADRLEVNRTSKGSLLMDSPVVLQKRQKLGQAEQLQ
ncbi:MAG: DUF882 domain-containing protein [Rhizobiales bacterium]|nr:DUF882 domain-containing protein [Hyphomicrobiales bacterium]